MLSLHYNVLLGFLCLFSTVAALPQHDSLTIARADKFVIGTMGDSWAVSGRGYDAFDTTLTNVRAALDTLIGRPTAMMTTKMDACGISMHGPPWFTHIMRSGHRETPLVRQISSSERALAAALEMT